MNRLFGSGKKAPGPSLNDALTSLDSRVEAIDHKIRKLDSDLLRYKEQLANLPPTHPSRESLKRQALQTLQQKKQYEQQRMTMMGQSFNLEQANFTVESMRSTKDTVTVMQTTAKEMKKQMKVMDVGKVEDLRDTMEDLMMETEEINQVLSRSYGTPEYLDEADLEAELGALEEYQGIEEQPSYLRDLPSAPTNKEGTSTAPISNRHATPEMNSK